jgi:hypothetical protein
MPLIAAEAFPPASSACYSGAWYEPSTTGSGIILDVSATSKTVAWFTFNAGNPVWFTASGAPQDTTLVLYQTAGVSVVQPATQTSAIGIITLNPIDANLLHFTWQINFPTAYCSGFGPGDPLCVGAKTLTRLTSPIPCT